MILVCISLMVSNSEHFFPYFCCCLHLFFWEIPIQILLFLTGHVFWLLLSFLRPLHILNVNPLSMNSLIIFFHISYVVPSFYCQFTLLWWTFLVWYDFILSVFEIWLWKKHKQHSEMNRSNIWLSYLLSIYSKIIKSIFEEDMNSTVHYNRTHKNQGIMSNYLPISRWTDTENVPRTRTGAFFIHRKNEILKFIAKWMKLEVILLSEIRQTQKNKHCMISLICGNYFWKVGLNWK